MGTPKALWRINAARRVGINGHRAWIVCATLVALATPALGTVTAYVSGPGSPTSPPTLTAINVASNVIVATVPLPGSHPAFGVALSPDRTHAYMTEPLDDLVSVLDTKTNTITTTFAVLGNPNGLAVHPVNGRVYVAQLGDAGADGSVAVINPTTYTVDTEIPVGASCHAADVAITPDGNFAYVTGYCGAPGSGRTFVIDTTSNALIDPGIVVTATAFGLSITPDGHFVYIGSQSNTNVSVIDTHSNTVVATVSSPAGDPLGPQPVVAPGGGSVYVAGYSLNVISTATNSVTGTYDALGGQMSSALAITPDGHYLYATSPLGPNTVVIDTTTNSVVTSIAMDGGNRIAIANVSGAPTPPPTPKPTKTPTPRGMTCPRGAAMAQPRSYAYVTTDVGSIDVVDVSTSPMSLVTTIPIRLPKHAALNATGSRLYVTSGASGVAVINTLTNKIIDRIPLPGSSSGITFSPSGDRIYIGGTVGGNLRNPVFGVAIVDPGTDGVLATVPLSGVPNYPGALALSPDATRLYVSDTAWQTVWVIDTATNRLIASPGEWNGTHAAGAVMVSPDGSRVYVPLEYDMTLSILDSASLSLIAKVPIGFYGSGAVLDGGGRMYLAGADGVELLDLNALTVLARIPLTYGSAQLLDVGSGMALNASSSRLFVGTSSWTGDAGPALTAVDTLSNTVSETMLLPGWGMEANVTLSPEFRCGNGIVEPCEQCDDGNNTNFDGCSASCQIEFIAGGSARGTDCLTEWLVANPNNAAGLRATKQVCKDNDQSCDFDGGVAGSCTFQVAACANVSDPTVPRCVPEATLIGAEVMKPSVKDAARSSGVATIRDQLTGMLQSLLSTAAGTCAPPVQITVPVSTATRPTGQVIRTRVTGASGRRDLDAVTLVCVP